jgi:uncharacterized ferredoxin-like protein
VKKLLPIEELGKLYRFNPFFARAAKDMREAGFNVYRGVRGDGNCFYRSAAIGFVTNLAMKN